MQTEATAAVPCIRDESLCSRFSDEGSRLLRFSCFPSAVARSFLCCSVALFPPKQTSTGIVVHTPNWSWSTSQARSFKADLFLICMTCMIYSSSCCRVGPVWSAWSTVAHASWIGYVLQYQCADPAQPLTTAWEELDDLDDELSVDYLICPSCIIAPYFTGIRGTRNLPRVEENKQVCTRK